MMTLSSYKIQTLQRQTDQNKAEQETFCEDISQRIENDPDLLDGNDLNDVAVVEHLLLFLSPEIRLLNVDLSFYQVHCSCQNLPCIAAVLEELILWQSTPQRYTTLLHLNDILPCYVLNRSVESILVSKESPRTVVYTT